MPKGKIKRFVCVFVCLLVFIFNSTSATWDQQQRCDVLWENVLMIGVEANLMMLSFYATSLLLWPHCNHGTQSLKCTFRRWRHMRCLEFWDFILEKNTVHLHQMSGCCSTSNQENLSLYQSFSLSIYSVSILPSICPRYCMLSKFLSKIHKTADCWVCFEAAL